MADLDETYRAVAADRDRFDEEERSLWRRAVAHAFGRNPRDAIALGVVAVAVGAILLNCICSPAPILRRSSRSGRGQWPLPNR